MVQVRRGRLVLGATVVIVGTLTIPVPPGFSQPESAKPQSTGEKPIQPGGPQPSTGKPDTNSDTRTPAQQPQADVLNLDIEALSQVQVRPPTTPASTGTGNVLTPSTSESVAPTSIGELLEQAPSVSVRRTSAINLDARVRGFQSSQLNASANGTTQLKTRVDIDSLFSQIDPGIVQGLEVIDGPYTTLYGPGFAFLTADLLAPPRYSNGPEFHGSTLFATKSNGRQLYTGDHLWGGGPDWGFQLGYGLRTGNDYGPGADGYDTRVPASYRQQDVFLALGLDPTADTRLVFDFIHQDIYDLELPGVAYDIAHSATNQFNGRWIYQERHCAPEQLVLQFWAQRTSYHGDASHFSKQVTFFNSLLGQPVPELLGGNLINEGRSESTGARAQTIFGFKDTLQLTLGADWRHYEQFYRERDFTASGMPVFAGNAFGIPQSSIEDIGLFAQLSNPITKEVTVTVGGRVDWTKAFIDATDPVTFTPAGDPVGGIFRPGFGEPRDTLGMGFVSTQYKPCGWLQFQGGVAFAMRNANLAELYSDEPYVPYARFGNSFVDGNSALSPEEDLQFDLGATASGKQASLGIRVFQATIYDYILGVPSDAANNFVPAGVAAPTNLMRNLSAFGLDPNDPAINVSASTHSVGYRYSNLDRVELYGGQLAGDWHPLDWLGLFGTLSYVRGINHSPVRYDSATQTLVPLKSNEALLGIYPLNAMLGVRIFEPRRNKWSVELITRMVQSQQHVADSLGELPTAGFTVFGIHGAYQLTPHIRLLTSLENLFDRPYSEHGSLVITNPNGLLDFVKEPGFSFNIGLEAKF